MTSPLLSVQVAAVAEIGGSGSWKDSLWLRAGFRPAAAGSALALRTLERQAKRR